MDSEITLNITMKLVKTLLVVLLVVCIKTIDCKGLGDIIDKNSLEDNLDKPSALVESNNNLRGLKDVWNKIKESAISSWNYVRELALSTQEKLGKYIEDVKEYASGLGAAVGEQLQKLKERLQEIIEDIYGTRELVTQCIQKERDTIDELMKGLLKQMSDCIMSEIKKLMQIGSLGSKADLALNNTEYLEDLDNKFEACENDLEHVEECMNNIRYNVLEDVSEIENDILKSSADVRNLADDVKNTIVTCSMDNIADASYFISHEIMEIAKCVLDSSSTDIEAENKPIEEKTSEEKKE